MDKNDDYIYLLAIVGIIAIIIWFGDLIILTILLLITAGSFLFGLNDLNSKHDKSVAPYRFFISFIFAIFSYVYYSQTFPAS
jgi:hypothetical protein